MLNTYSVPFNTNAIYDMLPVLTKKSCVLTQNVSNMHPNARKHVCVQFHL